MPPKVNSKVAAANAKKEAAAAQKDKAAAQLAEQKEAAEWKVAFRDYLLGFNLI